MAEGPKKRHEQEAACRREVPTQSQNAKFITDATLPSVSFDIGLSNEDWSDLHLSGPVILVSAEVQSTASTPVRIFCCVSTFMKAPNMTYSNFSCNVTIANSVAVIDSMSSTHFEMQRGPRDQVHTLSITLPKALSSNC